MQKQTKQLFLLLGMKMTIGVEVALNPMRACSSLHLHSYYSNVTGGIEAPLIASHPQPLPALCLLCFLRWATPITYPAHHHIPHRVTQLIQMMTVYWWIMIQVSVTYYYATDDVCAIVSGSASSLKKHKQHSGHEGRRKELPSKLLDSAEYRGQQYNNGSPLHSSQLKMNSKKR